MARGVVTRRPREASSEASYWDDDTNSPFADVVTPPLRSDVVLPSVPAKEQLNTASHPITILDTQPEPLPMQQQGGLALELFPSGRSSTDPPNRQSHPPSSFDFDAAAGIEPWTQPGLKATQYLRDEWLISAGQKQPNDLVEDYVPNIGDSGKASTSRQPDRSRLTTARVDHMAPALRSVLADRAHLDAPKEPIAKRGRSSLLDQLDAICSSPSQRFSSSPITNEPTTIPTTPTTARAPLAPASSIVSNGKASSAQKIHDQPAVIDLLEVSSSPPAQPPQQHITLIKDMPQELQNIYRRLAFGRSGGVAGGSSSSTPSTPINAGTTARGTRGKTWQTTWQDDGDQDGQSADGATSSSGSRANAASSALTSGRGRKPTSAASRDSRTSKSRSSASGSSSAASKGKSRFFTFKNFRSRGRGRGRGRGNGR
ncbi:hypothetical protein PHSY_003545 [Pseudozyma hubeiensis SY62]|uniref:Uncharacterized protein n=1 Tax=Pseudozyma hubeiensis (strain SY62) TaxID=1305764 RepID=R9P3Z6_PSEHS|nr:hypothetical protein PHSY_003545 [Pseudozyma hubeiensis SY62]GAC95967.1 hypothetical protein PHSY_003545 [Pseudozyma hubeiensis SY62]